FELSAAEFTSARNALAAKLKKEGKGDRAEEVKALGKPTAAAHAVNLLARKHGAKLRELAHAGEALRKAQRSLLKGEGRDAFQAAVARERELVAELVQLAREFTDSEAALSRVSETLHAA